MRAKRTRSRSERKEKRETGQKRRKRKKLNRRWKLPLRWDKDQPPLRWQSGGRGREGHCAPGACCNYCRCTLNTEEKRGRKERTAASSNFFSLFSFFPQGLHRFCFRPHPTHTHTHTHIRSIMQQREEEEEEKQRERERERRNEKGDHVGLDKNTPLPRGDAFPLSLPAPSPSASPPSPRRRRIVAPVAVGRRRARVVSKDKAEKRGEKERGKGEKFEAREEE